jgi:hypothetical protein
VRRPGPSRLDGRKPTEPSNGSRLMLFTKGQWKVWTPIRPPLLASDAIAK